jgi:hypothetical protein
MTFKATTTLCLLTVAASSSLNTKCIQFFFSSIAMSRVQNINLTFYCLPLENGKMLFCFYFSGLFEA